MKFCLDGSVATLRWFSYRYNNNSKPVNRYRLRLCHRLRQIYIVCMVTVRMGFVPILSVKWYVPIGTMMNFDEDAIGHGNRDGKCKQTLSYSMCPRNLWHLQPHHIKSIIICMDAQINKVNMQI